jgi:hypothetical protein
MAFVASISTAGVFDFLHRKKKGLDVSGLSK